METNVATLRAEVLQAINAVFQKYASSPSEIPTKNGLAISRVEPLTAPWEYRWPNDRENYTTGNWYDVSWPTGKTRVLVGHCMRRAWGKDRGRVVVFGQFGPADSKTFYPWTEFVEADDGTYVADIPDPAAPRSLLKATRPIPRELAEATIRRNDEVFDSIQNGPGLRLVVGRDDEEEMIRHGHWVAMLRGRIR